MDWTSLPWLKMIQQAVDMLVGMLKSPAARNKISFALPLLVVTYFTFSRLLNEGLHAHIYDFGNEALRAVQAWENHGFLAMGGMYPWGRTYYEANHFPEIIYRSKTPLHLLPLWAGYRLFGESAYHLFKLYWSLAIVILIALLLATIATACFASIRAGNRQLVFGVTYSIAITNEALLRYCLVDEPQYLGLLLHLAGVVLLLGWIRQPFHAVGRLRSAAGTFFLASWTYPILGGINWLTLMGLSRLRLGKRLRKGLRSILIASILGPILYFLQRFIASAMFPGRLLGQSLPTRMGFTPDKIFHNGVFDALEFLIWQKSGLNMEESGVALSHALEHYGIWVIGLCLFVLCLARSCGNRQLLLILAAGEMWLFIPLFHQTLSQHPWIYGILFMPSVVLGWVGGLALLLPKRKINLFAPSILASLGVLIWAIQLRFFLANYLAF